MQYVLDLFQPRYGSTPFVLPAKIFATCGDCLHVASFLLLAAHLRASRSAAAVSVKSLYLTLAVFLSRYIDLVHISGDTYLLCMRLLYWAIGIGFVLWVTDVEPWQSSVDHARDTAFPRLWTVMAPLFVVSVALFYTAEPFASDKFGLYNPLNEIGWIFSLFLEAIALLPQLMFTHSECDAPAPLLSHFLAAKVMYKCLYLCNWVVKFSKYGTKHYVGWLLSVGTLQVLFQVDFLVYYFRRYLFGGRKNYRNWLVLAMLRAGPLLAKQVTMTIGITPFQYAGDFCHLLSFYLIVYRLWKTRGAGGISLKTQELCLLVFVTRYLDIFHNLDFTHGHNLYLFTMKALYLSVTGGIVYVLRIREPWRTSYLSNTAPSDKFPHLKYAVAPCIAIALFVNEGSLFTSEEGFFTTIFKYSGEVLYAFSLFLEAVAIVPQLIVLHSEKIVENLTSHYVASLGAYRALYIFNWIYKYSYYGTTHWIVWLAGTLQTALFIDFFYYYVKSKSAGMKHVALPQ